MQFIICQDWHNTKGNHAGMAHLGRLIQQYGKKKYRLIIIPDIGLSFSNRLINSLYAKLIKYIYDLLYICLAIYLLFTLKRGDRVYLFEYLLESRNQYFVAKILKTIKKEQIEIYALAHLTPSKLEQKFSHGKIMKYSLVVDKYLTLGNSLSKYLNKIGIEKNKFITTFHYVDTDYYYPKLLTNLNEHLKVLVMGVQMRDFSFIVDLSKKLPDVEFVICKWKMNLGGMFDDCTNVVLKGVMPENELKEEMDKADISLNIMIDTVGSNVITTSIAMGLAMVVSDVGSIRDYCSEEYAYLCRDEKDYYKALTELSRNKIKLEEMKKKSFEMSKKFNYRRFIGFIDAV